MGGRAGCRRITSGGVMVLGIVAFAVGAFTGGGGVSANDNPNTVAYWCGSEDAGFKVQVSASSYTVPAPPSGYTWTKLVLKTANEPEVVIDNPVVGQTYTSGVFNQNDQEQDISHIILCKQPQSTTTTSTTTTTTTVPETSTTSTTTTTTTTTVPETTSTSTTTTVPETTSTSTTTTVPETTSTSTTTTLAQTTSTVADTTTTSVASEGPTTTQATTTSVASRGPTTTATASAGAATSGLPSTGRGSRTLMVLGSVLVLAGYGLRRLARPVG